MGTLRFGALVRLWYKQISLGYTLGSCVSARALLTTASEETPRQRCDPAYSDKGRNGSHSIICKVTCCLLSLFLLHISFVFKCLGSLRTDVTVKLQNELLMLAAPCPRSTAVDRSHVFNFFLVFCFVFCFCDFFSFFDTCLTCMCCKNS